MSPDKDVQRGIDAILQQDGGRIHHLFRQLQHLAMSRQPADVTLYSGKPHINVKIGQKFLYALMYGAGAEKLRELLSMLELSNGATVSITDIWTINPMPAEGFTNGELEAVDLGAAEEKVGPNGETLRKMISETYHCSSKEEEDRYLRRFIAS
jgi:DNA replication protein DnaD